VKDHIIPHLSEKNTTKEMFNFLVGLFQSKNMNRKMVLRNNLMSMHMYISNYVTIYFMRITQVRDHLATIWEKIEEAEILNLELNGIPKSWEPFIK
jgi:hypothetical protein